MTTTRPLPPHGTYARANGSPGIRPGCKCDPCAQIKRAVRKRNRINRELGRRSRVDAGPARERLALLKQTMSWGHIASATGCDTKNLTEIFNGDHKEIYRTTQDKIMSVRMAPTPDRGLFINATGTIRRVRAMQVIGHSCRVIAEAADTTTTRIQIIKSGTQPTVRQTIAERIERAYQQLASQPAPDNRFTRKVRTVAAAKNWDGPEAWDPDTIDDPNAQPATGDEPELKRDELAALRREEIKHLASFGVSEYDIATRLDMATKTVHQILDELRTGTRRNRTQKQEAAA